MATVPPEDADQAPDEVAPIQSLQRHPSCSHTHVAKDKCHTHQSKAESNKGKMSYHFKADSAHLGRLAPDEMILAETLQRRAVHHEVKHTRSCETQQSGLCGHGKHAPAVPDHKRQETRTGPPTNSKRAYSTGECLGGFPSSNQSKQFSSEMSPCRLISQSFIPPHLEPRKLELRKQTICIS